MDSSNQQDNEKEELKNKKPKNKLGNIKSDYFIIILFNYLQRNKALQIIQYNKKTQRKLKINNIEDYKEYSETYSSIELEIIPVNYKYGIFINIFNKANEKYFHIYFNDDKEEIKRNYINPNDNVTKINITIDYPIKSFYALFCGCECIESINFKKFYRNNIISMQEMFIRCTSLKEINLSNFNTDNISSMRYMFANCSLLKKLDVSSLNTSKVYDMSFMFYQCSSLKEIKNISNFNTNKVLYMAGMFCGCSELEEINLSNFNTNNVKDVIDMFSGCSADLKMKIRSQFHNIKEGAFRNSIFTI